MNRKLEVRFNGGRAHCLSLVAPFDAFYDVHRRQNRAPIIVNFHTANICKLTSPVTINVL